MAMFASVFTWLIIINWPCLLALSYTKLPKQTRFVLQTFCIIPIALSTSLICCIIGWIVKYLTFSLLTADIRIYLLSHITHQFWQINLFIFEFWVNLRYVVSDENVNEDLFYLNTIIVCNHSESPFDWITLGSIADFLGRFANSFVFMKKEFAYVPMIGWVGSLCNAISLDRNWAADQIKIRELAQKFKANADYKRVTPWIWFSYPEGTRFTNKRLLAAQAFAKERGFPIYSHLLQPRVKGFSYLTHHLHEKLGCIMDTTCLYQPKPPQLRNFFLNTRLCQYTHIHLRVYRQREIPRGTENDLSKIDQWLRDRWTEKDEIMAAMKNKEINYVILKRSPWKAIAHYVIWTLLIIYLVFVEYYEVGFNTLYIASVAALFPVIIVLIEQAQNSEVSL